MLLQALQSEGAILRLLDRQLLLVLNALQVCEVINVLIIDLKAFKEVLEPLDLPQFLVIDDVLVSTTVHSESVLGVVLCLQTTIQLLTLFGGCIQVSDPLFDAVDGINELGQ